MAVVCKEWSTARGNALVPANLLLCAATHIRRDYRRGRTLFIAGQSKPDSHRW